MERVVPLREETELDEDLGWRETEEMGCVKEYHERIRTSQLSV